MSKERKFSAGQLLGEGIRRLGREELIALALEICADAADCGAEFHGNIHPGNISRGEGGAALGPRADPTGRQNDWGYRFPMSTSEEQLTEILPRPIV